MLINLRNALMAGKRLPYDAELEYLESTGTQWIDTGVVADSDTRITIGMSLPQISATTVSFGAAGMQSNIARNFSRQYFGTTTEAFSHNDIVIDVRFDLDMDAPMKRVVLNGTAKTINWTTAWTCADAFPLFAFVSGGQVTYRSCRVYSCKIWGDNNVLVRDFIPVRKGTVGYLYDRVSGKLFGNAGTGDFVLGQDVVPVEWMDGGQLNGGIAFIDTGYTPNSSTKIKSTAAILTASGYSGRFGNRSRLTFGAFTNGNLYLAQGDHYYLGGDWTAGTFYSFVNDIPNRTVSVEGVGSTSTAAVSDWYPQLYPVYLFASNVAPIDGTAVNSKILDTNSLGRIRMKSCDILENEIPVHSYRPVRVGSGSSWEGAMMDILTRRIYRNAGTGAFTYGNDLKYPIPA